LVGLLFNPDHGGECSFGTSADFHWTTRDYIPESRMLYVTHIHWYLSDGTSEIVRRTVSFWMAHKWSPFTRCFPVRWHWRGMMNRAVILLDDMKYICKHGCIQLMWVCETDYAGCCLRGCHAM
jgi:hypothetical protein